MSKKNQVIIAEQLLLDPFCPEPPAEAYHEWSEEDLSRFFDSGGHDFPRSCKTDADAAAIEEDMLKQACFPGTSTETALDSVPGEPGSWKIGELKRFLQARKISITGVVDKDELVQVVRKILSGELDLGSTSDSNQSSEKVHAYAKEHPRNREYFNGGGKGFLTDTESLGFDLPNSAETARKVSESFSLLGGAKDVRRSKLQMASIKAPERDEDDTSAELATERYLERSIPVGSINLHYVTWGRSTDRPVLLLHGINQTAFSWEELAVALADKMYYVIALECRGHGDSDWSRIPKDYSCNTIASDIRQFLRQLDLPTRPACIAYQMGAAAATSLPAEFSALVLVEYTPEMAPDKFTYFYWQAMRYPSLEDAVAHMWTFARGRRTVENIRRRLRHSMRKQEDGSWGYKMDPDFYFSYDETNKWKELHMLTCPTLVVRGNDSHLWDVQSVDKVVRALKNATSVSIPRAGHWVAGDNKSGFRDAVLGFLQKHAPPPPCLHSLE
mmetsp:Transcript_8944/g.16849  ORF Transcript_8944/g.16849 Transcript_8944/m.16849 type:complete len:500 (+) Transcript_8944:82-1581(+)